MPPYPRPSGARLAPLLAAGALALGAAAALFRGERGFKTNLGEALAVEGVALLALSWFAYLRRDGLRLPGRRPRGEAAASWKDRVPGLGQAPLAPRPIPGPAGPEDPAYARLAEAEARLRKRMAGESESAEGAAAEGVRGARGERGASGGPAPGLALPALAAGLAVLAAALCLQYLL